MSNTHEEVVNENRPPRRERDAERPKTTLDRILAEALKELYGRRADLDEAIAGLELAVRAAAQRGERSGRNSASKSAAAGGSKD